MKAKDITIKDTDVFPPEITLRQAAEIMRNQDISFLPIGKHDRLLGAITDRDLVIRGIAEGKDINLSTVQELMPDEVRHCFENDSLEKAKTLMCCLQLRRLAVLNDKKHFIGVISMTDVNEAMS